MFSGVGLVRPVAPKTKKRSRKTGRRRRKRKVSTNPPEPPNRHESYSGEPAAVVRQTTPLASLPASPPASPPVCARALFRVLVRIYEACMVSRERKRAGRGLHGAACGARARTIAPAAALLPAGAVLDCMYRTRARCGHCARAPRDCSCLVCWSAVSGMHD